MRIRGARFAERNATICRVATCGRLCAALWWLLLLSGSVCGDEPTASYIFPAGGQRGTTVEFRVGGHYLHDGAAFHIEGATGAVVERLQRQQETVWFEGPLLPLPESQQKEDYPVEHRGRMEIGADAYPGERWWRVSTSQGVTAGMPFVVGDLPEITEQEIDGRPLPTAVTLPLTVNGRIYPREDIDIWTFEAEAGEVICCEVSAQRLKSPLDAVLQVTGPGGETVVRCDDSIGRDPRVVFTAVQAGRYAVRVWDAEQGGLQHYVYRLTLQRGPVVQSVYPLGAQAGTEVQLELTGVGLTQSSRTLSIPAGTEPGFRSDLAGVPFEVSEFPELAEQEPNNDMQSGRSVSAGMVLNGRIQSAGDADYWIVTLQKGSAVQLKLTAAELRSPLDSLLQLYDAAGKLVAESDNAVDGQPDSLLLFQPPEDGVYAVRVSDRFDSRGGPEYSYRLSLRDAAALRPSFSLSLAADFLNLKRGGESKIKVLAERLHGHSGAIPLELRGLPSGVVVEGAEIAAGRNETQLTFRAEAAARVCVSAVEVCGVGEWNGVRMEYPARVEGPATGAAGGHLWLAVTVATPFRFVGDFETRYAARGSAFTRRYRIERGGYEGPLRVSLAERQTRHLQGVTGPVIEVPAGQNEFEYTVNLPPWMEIGRTSRTCLMAVGQVMTEDGHSHDVSYTSFEQNDQIIVLVDPGRMNLRLERSSLLANRGGESDLRFEVQRGADLAGPLRVELLLPRHMQGIVCEPVQLNDTETAGVLKLRFGGAGAGPLNMPLVVRATVGVGANRTCAESPLVLIDPAADSVRGERD